MVSAFECSGQIRSVGSEEEGFFVRGDGTAVLPYTVESQTQTLGREIPHLYWVIGLEPRNGMEALIWKFEWKTLEYTRGNKGVHNFRSLGYSKRKHDYHTGMRQTLGNISEKKR